MKFITVSNEFFELCGDDPEILNKGDRRPHVLLLSLKYKGRKADFAVPLRSNIPPSAPKEQYFPLPPRRSTKQGHRHGLHYIKMFPIKKQYREKFWTGKNKQYVLYQSIIEKNENRIVAECQAYLDAYSAGKVPAYAVDIDRVFEKLCRKASGTE